MNTITFIDTSLTKFEAMSSLKQQRESFYWYPLCFEKVFQFMFLMFLHLSSRLCYHHNERLCFVSVWNDKYYYRIISELDLLFIEYRRFRNEDIYKKIYSQWKILNIHSSLKIKYLKFENCSSTLVICFLFR